MKLEEEQGHYPGVHGRSGQPAAQLRRFYNLYRACPSPGLWAALPWVTHRDTHAFAMVDFYLLAESEGFPPPGGEPALVLARHYQAGTCLVYDGQHQLGCFR